MNQMTKVEKRPAKPATTKKPAKPATPAKVPTESEVPTTPDAAIAPRLVPSAPQLFPLSVLRRAEENVRHTRVDEDVPGLADDIAAHGLLQSLIGYIDNDPWPEDAGRVFVVGGGRRLQALKLLQERGVIGGDFTVPVLVRDVAEAIELSLAENLQQRTMSPVDEFLAFRALMENGANSPASLAKRFGFSERLVKQRLRLAELDDDILTALAAREITIDAAMAYASTQNPKLQQAVFKAHSKKGAWDAHVPTRIRRDLNSAGMDTGDQLYRFVGAEAYEAAGGGYEDDLFNEERTERILTHAHLVETLAHDRVDAAYGRMLPELVRRADLAPTITGYVKVPDLRLQSWGTQAKLKEPAGFAKIDRYDHAAAWKTVRNNALEARVLLGVDPKGELVVWPNILFVPADQKTAVDPREPQRPYVAPTPQQQAAAARQAGIDRWAKRLAVGPFTGTPLEDRAFWGNWADGRNRDGVAGYDVEMVVFVTEAEVAAQREAAEVLYDRELAEEMARTEARKAAEGEAKRRLAELAAMDPPAIIVIDGEPWARADDGSYAALGDDEDAIEDWATLLDHFGAIEIESTWPTRDAFDAAMRAAGADLEGAVA